MPEPEPVTMLLEIARVVWPGRGVQRHWPDAVSVGFREGGETLWFRPEQTDSIRRILLACTPEQREAFERNLSFAIGARTGLAYDRVFVQPSASEIITADVATVLIPALHRAICGKP